MTVSREIIFIPPVLHEDASDVNFVAQVSYSASFFGNIKAVFLYSLVRFSTPCSATELRPGSVVSPASHQPSPQRLLRIYPHSLTSAQIAFWLPACLCLWVACIKKPAFSSSSCSCFSSQWIISFSFTAIRDRDLSWTDHCHQSLWIICWIITLRRLYRHR